MSGSRKRQPPIDPRLWKASRHARHYLVLSVLLGIIQAGQLIIIAWCAARVAAGVITTPSTRHWGAWTLEICLFAAMIVMRGVVGWFHDRYAHRAAGRVVGDLRHTLIEVATSANPRHLAEQRDELRTIATHGLGGLEPYLVSYVPALVLSATVTPLVWAAILLADITSGITIAVTMPLIPLFMILVGLLTEERTRNYLTSMTRLSSTLLDLIAGLPTLIGVGREHEPAAHVRTLGERHRDVTLASLRIAFLSSAVLELLSTLCVAVVAVSLGFRLMGHGWPVQLSHAIFILVLVADVYKPLRQVGSKFHDSEDGQYAASRAFEAIAAAQAAQQSPAAASAVSQPGPQQESAPLTCEVRNLSIAARNQACAPRNLSFEARPGAVTVVTGENGAGKSTTILALLALIPATEGTILINGQPIEEWDRAALWGALRWLPQRPAIIAGTVRDNIGDYPDEVLDHAAHITGFDHVVKQLEDGYDTWLGSGGLGMSLGQRQRLALTRTVADRSIRTLILDEPTAHLDTEAEDRVLAHLRQRAEEGDTIILVGHRDAVLRSADTVIRVHSSSRITVLDDNGTTAHSAENEVLS